jgi:hypothetical protein
MKIRIEYLSEKVDTLSVQVKGQAKHMLIIIQIASPHLPKAKDYAT